jgi:hypothetical protein
LTFALLNIKRNNGGADDERAKKQARELYKAGELESGTLEEVFVKKNNIF